MGNSGPNRAGFVWEVYPDLTSPPNMYSAGIVLGMITAFFFVGIMNYSAKE